MLLAFLLPGSVYQFVRSRLRGPHPDDTSALNRVLRALGVSTALVSLYAVFVGPPVLELAIRVSADGRTSEWHSIRPLALWALTLLFVVPTILAGAVYYAAKVPRPDWLEWTRLSYDPTPRAWDFAFNGIAPVYVRVLTTDGRYLGGWFGNESFVSSYPEPREIFLEIAHQMSEDGEFGPEVEGSRGLYVRCDDIRLVELVGSSEGSTVQ
jgi:hypothetical protein